MKNPFMSASMDATSFNKAFNTRTIVLKNFIEKQYLEVEFYKRTVHYIQRTDSFVAVRNYVFHCIILACK